MANASISGAPAVASADFLEMRGGPSGVRILKNDGTVVNWSVTDPGAVSVPVSLTVGAGTAITNIQSLPTALTPAAVAANTTAEQLFAVAGLAVNDKVFVNKPTAQAGLGIVGFRVAGVNSLGITFSNNTAGAITPTAAETYQIVAIRS